MWILFKVEIAIVKGVILRATQEQLGNNKNIETVWYFINKMKTTQFNEKTLLLVE